MPLSDNSHALDIMYERGRGDEAKVLFLSPQGGHFIDFPKYTFNVQEEFNFFFSSEIVDTI